MGFVPTISALERAKIFFALDGEAVVIGSVGGYVNKAFSYSLFFFYWILFCLSENIVLVV
jgi:hypothetical protein